MKEGAPSSNPKKTHFAFCPCGLRIADYSSALAPANTDLRIYGFTDYVFPRNQKLRICDTDFMDSVYGFYGLTARILRIYTDTDLIRA
jgi:hypothetical protein